MNQQDPIDETKNTETIDAIFRAFKDEIQALKFEQENIIQEYVLGLSEKKNKTFLKKPTE